MSKRQYQARKSNFETMKSKMDAPCAVIKCTRAAVTDQWQPEYLGIMPYRKALALRRKADKTILDLTVNQVQQGGLLAYTNLMTEGHTDEQVKAWVAANLNRRSTRGGHPINMAAYEADKHLLQVMQVSNANDAVQILGKKFIDKTV